MAGITLDSDAMIYEAVAMARSRDKAMWNHTGTVCALIANMMRGKGQPSYDVSDFSPYADRIQKGMPMSEYLRAMEGRIKNG